MPVVAFRCPKCSQRVEFEQAIEHFSEIHPVMYHATVQSLISQQDDERRQKGAGLSASIACGDATCRRKVCLQRFYDYVLDPRMVEEAEEGNVIHSAMHKRGSGGVWVYETPLPGPGDEGKPGVRRNPGGWFEYEMFPGVWVSAIVDAHTQDWSTIDDLMTQRASRTVRSPELSHKVQLNIAKFLAEKLGYGPVKRLRIWKYQRGCYEPENRHKVFEFEEKDVWDEGALRLACEDHLTSLAGFLDNLDQLSGEPQEYLDAYMKKVPMDGDIHKLFNGKMCSQYCEVRDLCFKLAGKVSFY